ncbi:CPBP family intramembrane glutamic endopeptidase [Haloglomus salinum]|jgi:membrane protease YdiL (CAAX protease family)|uniref:CPBP family intramembrane glutamic endopeptidase n=1 Tax=Haloglomus salinum TaxID=2962673 RepID=UPI0020C966D7|nr:type II CAAX endopeptidase family protein [Haloglomus salinum]
MSSDAISAIRRADAAGERPSDATARGGRRDARAVARAALVAAGLTVLGLLAGTLLGLVPVIVEVFLTGAAAFAPPTLLASTVLTMAGYAAVGLWFARQYGVAIPARRPTRRDVGWITGGTLLALAGVTVSLVALASLGVEAAPNAIGGFGEAMPVLFLALAALSVVAIGPAEEILFRGAVQGRLRATVGPVGAVVGAGALFASIHAFAVVGALGATLTTVAIIFVLSTVLGVAYERTRNIVVPALLHGFYNATLFVFAYVGTAGL